MTRVDGADGLRLHVAVVNRHLRNAVGGSELQCDLVARGLVARGHRVAYLAVVPAGAREARRPDGGGPPPYALDEVGDSAADLVAAIRAHAPDVVYWRYGRRLLGPVARGLRAAGIPIVLAVAHADDVARWPRRPWPAGLRHLPAEARDRLRHRRSYGALSRLAGIASQREDQLGSVPSVPARLVRNLVPTADAVVPRAEPRPYVAWIGNLKPRKRPEVCRDLASGLAPLGVDVLMAGAVQDPAYAALASDDPALPNLRYLGRLDAPDVTALIAGAICVPVTYRPEGFSNVLLQAWALGRPTPTLGYDPDGLIAAEGLGGVAGDDVPRFVGLVRDLVTDPALASEAGRCAARLVRERFDPDVALDRLEDLLATVARRSR